MRLFEPVFSADGTTKIIVFSDLTLFLVLEDFVKAGRDEVCKSKATSTRTCLLTVRKAEQVPKMQ